MNKEVSMSRRALFVSLLLAPMTLCLAEETGKREFRATSGQRLTLDLEAGGSVKILGDGGGSVVVDHSECEGCVLDFEERKDGLRITTRMLSRSHHQHSSLDLVLHVPRRFDIALDSAGGSFEIDGVEGTFDGQTMGGHLKLHDVKGEARLKTMGGAIELTDSDLDGSLETMGGQVLFRDVVGDVKGSSMGGNVRYERVHRRNGKTATLDRLGDEEVSDDTVQISTMGGGIEVEDAPEGAAVHTMGGDIHIKDAQRFVRATTMGGDVTIDRADGSVQATTMGGNVEATVVGSGGDVELRSMSGDITLTVPRGFGMDLDLEIAFTRDSDRNYRIESDLDLERKTTDDWDYGHGSPRKYLRAEGKAGSGKNRVTIKTVNGNIKIVTR
jgi:putative adhesin